MSDVREPWVRLDSDLHELVARTAAMEGYSLKQWICLALDAACKDESFTPPQWPPDRVEIDHVPDHLKRRCEQKAAVSREATVDWVRRTLRARCWSRTHLDTVAAAL